MNLLSFSFYIRNEPNLPKKYRYEVPRKVNTLLMTCKISEQHLNGFFLFSSFCLFFFPRYVLLVVLGVAKLLRELRSLTPPAKHLITAIRIYVPLDMELLDLLLSPWNNQLKWRQVSNSHRI